MALDLEYFFSNYISKLSTYEILSKYRFEEYLKNTFQKDFGFVPSQNIPSDNIDRLYQNYVIGRRNIKINQILHEL